MVAGPGLTLLLLAGLIGIVYLALRARKGALPLAAFLVAGAGMAVVLGLASFAPVVARMARSRPGTAVVWTVLLALGFAVAGLVMAAAWHAVVRGLSALLRRPPPAGRG